MHPTAIVTDPVVTRRARTVGISGRVFADGNADRPVESANVDISARHPRDANADPVAICLPDAYVDRRKTLLQEANGIDVMHPVRKFKPDSGGTSRGMTEGRTN